MNDTAMFAALLRRDFPFFLRFAYKVLGGEGAYDHNWHIDAIAYELARCVNGDNRRLIVTMPPRHLKSTTVSIAWVAWMLGHNPALRFITVSYGSELADKQGRDMLRILDHPLYRMAFPGLEITRHSAQDLETSLGGGRLSTSLRGVLTGRGADYIIIDDPTKSQDAASRAVRESDAAWLLNTLMTRLNNPATGVIVLVMQRLHEGDLVGVLHEQGGWHELTLPAIAPVDAKIPIGGGRIYHRRAGHALHPARQPLAALEEQRRAMGSYNFAAQYQQDPIPAEGNIVKADWLVTYEPGFDYRNAPGIIVQSWDTASSEGLSSDWTVCITAHVYRREVRIIDVFRRRLAFPDLKHHAIRLAREYGAKNILIEDCASGKQLLQTLRAERPAGVPWPRKIRPEHDKVTRLAGVSEMIEGGRLLLPRDAPWLAEFKSELLGFPGSKHDDQVDALSQLLEWVRKNGGNDAPSVVAPMYF